MRVKAAMLLMLLPIAALAGSKQAATRPPADEPPDAELLEFIAEFEQVGDQWLDPIQLNMIFAENRKGKENE